MKFRGVWFFSRRYLRSKRRERGLTAPLLSLLGLAVGVLTLNSVLAVMNGFQLTFIESLIEVSSSHLRWEVPPDTDSRVVEVVRKSPGVRSVEPYYETQTLIRGPFGEQRGAVLRGMDPQTFRRDEGLASHLKIVSGQLISVPHGQIMLGSELGRILGVNVGDEISLVALSGPQFSLLAPQSQKLEVCGFFRTAGYYEIDAGWAVVSIEDARDFFADANDFYYGVKLSDGNQDLQQRQALAAAIGAPVEQFASWRSFNAAFFGALRTEKTAMMVLIGLIFLVVGVNIFYALRRTVQEHREDIALLQAVGVDSARIRWIFAAEGGGIGAIGASLGTTLGVLIASFIPSILDVAEAAINAVAGIFRASDVTLFSSEAFYLPRIPARILPEEVLLIALFAALSATVAAWLASKQAARIPLAEVLKNE